MQKMTKYELSRVLGIRCNQLSFNAQPLVNVSADKKTNLMYIAALEIKSRKLSVVIQRNMPLETHVDININDLELPSELDDLISVIA